MVADGRLPRVGRRLRQSLRHRRGRRRARAGGRPGPRARHRRPGRPAGAAARRRAPSAIFVLPPSFEVLEQRLRGRSKDSEEAIRRRLATARAEVARRRRIRLRRRERRAGRVRRSDAGDRASPSGPRRPAARSRNVSRSARHQCIIDSVERPEDACNKFEFVVVSGRAAGEAAARTGARRSGPAPEKPARMAMKEVREARSRSIPLPDRDGDSA